MNQPEAEQVASALTMIRPDWLRSSLVTLMGNLPPRLRQRPARDVMLALVWLAFDPQQVTPRLLREDGPWWNLARMAGPGTQPATESLIVTHCTHGEPGSDCGECYPRTHHGVGPSAEQRAAWAAAIAAGRDAMAARAADRSQP